MSNTLIAIVSAAAFATGIGSFALAGSGADELVCGIHKSTQNGMLTIAGLVASDTALTGDYSFALNSRGNGGTSTINQGGPFSAAPGTTTTVGQAMVNAGSNLDIRFTITAGGKTYDCSSEVVSTT